MARPYMRNGKKFRRLVRELANEEDRVYGALGLLWDSCHEAGNPYITDLDDVEPAACWSGEPGAFVRALVKLNWLDQATKNRWQIHHYWHHAPEYVLKRKLRERDRVRAGKSGQQRRTMAATGQTPAPSPSPSPTPKHLRIGSQSAKHNDRSTENIRIDTTLKHALDGIRLPAPSEPEVWAIPDHDLGAVCATYEADGATLKNVGMWNKRVKDLADYKGGIEFLRDRLEHVLKSERDGALKGLGKFRNPAAYLNKETLKWAQDRTANSTARKKTSSS